MYQPSGIGSIFWNGSIWRSENKMTNINYKIVWSKVIILSSPSSTRDQVVEVPVTSYSSGSTSLPPLAFLSRKYYRGKKKKLHLLYELKMNRMECTGKNQLPLAQPRGHMHHPLRLCILCSLFPAFLGSYQTCRHDRVSPVVCQDSGSHGWGLFPSFPIVMKFLCLCHQIPANVVGPWLSSVENEGSQISERLPLFSIHCVWEEES